LNLAPKEGKENERLERAGGERKRGETLKDRGEETGTGNKNG
jgi:hypothetical protein